MNRNEATKHANPCWNLPSRTAWHAAVQNAMHIGEHTVELRGKQLQKALPAMLAQHMQVSGHMSAVLLISRCLNLLSLRRNPKRMRSLLPRCVHAYVDVRGFAYAYV